MHTRGPDEGGFTQHPWGAATFLAAILVLAFSECGAAQTSAPPAADSPSGAPCIGVLFWHDSPNDEAALQGIRNAFSETGRPLSLWVERADSDRDRAIRILADFRERKVDLVFAMGTQAALLAAHEMSRIPIVFTAVTHPVESGVVPSWEGSGRNLAGNSNWIASETLLQVFRLAVPGLSRIGILRSSTSGMVSAAELRAMRAFLARPGSPEMEIKEEVIRSVEEIRPAVLRLVEAKVQAIWIPIDFEIYSHMEEILEAAESKSVPLLSSALGAAEAGSVAGVVVDYRMLGQRAAAIALEILEQGADPGSLPVGTMHGYQVIVNLGAARRIDYEPPLALLVLADALIKDFPQEEHEEDEN